MCVLVSWERFYFKALASVGNFKDRHETSNPTFSSIKANNGDGNWYFFEGVDKLNEANTRQFFERFSGTFLGQKAVFFFFSFIQSLKSKEKNISELFFYKT